MKNASSLFLFITLFLPLTAEPAAHSIKLIPNPKVMNFAGGSTTLSADWVLVNNTGEAADDWAMECVIREAEDCFGWSWKTASSAPAEKYIIFQALDSGADEPDLFVKQGYILTIWPDKIVIQASTAQGRFYAAQTLRQVFRNANGKDIPKAYIKDYPSLEWRGLSDDISRGQVSTVEDFRRIIHELAFYKKNLYQPYIEDMFSFEADPAIGRTRGAITKAEMALLVEEARRNHITLTPVFECLGHQDRLLSLPHNRKYAELQDPSTNPWSFSPVSEEAFEFVTRLVDEMAAATPDSPFFHIGGDESSDVGKGDSKEQVEKTSVGEVHARYFSRLTDHIRKSHGRRTMLYSDMILHHLDDAKQFLDPECILVDWHYSPNEDFASIKKLKDAGFPNIVTSPGIWSWASYYPNFSVAFRNVAAAADAARNEQLMGCIASSWGDSGAENLRDNNWLGYAYSAACTWEDKSPDAERFRRRFAAIHFGDDSEEMAEALRMLGWYEYLETNYLGGIFHRPFQIKPSGDEWLAKFELLEKNMKSVLDILDKREKHFRFYKDYPDVLRHVARRNIYMARKESSQARIATMIGEQTSGELPSQDQKAIMDMLVSLRNDLASIYGEYPGLWLRTSKYPMLSFNTNRLEAQLGAIQNALVQAQTGGIRGRKAPRGSWMWYPDENPQKESGLGERFFVRVVKLDDKPRSAKIKCWADDAMDVFVNGEKIGRVTYYDAARSWDAAEHMKKGTNIIALGAENLYGAAGIMIEADIEIPGSDPLFLTCDDMWMTTDKTIKGWNEQEPKGKAWVPVKILGQGLIAPWKDLDW